MAKHDWEIAGWRMEHRTHGAFHISIVGDVAHAQRLHRANDDVPYAVESLGLHDRTSAAMMAVEDRIHELDAKLINTTYDALKRALAENAA